MQTVWVALLVLLVAASAGAQPADAPQPEYNPRYERATPEVLLPLEEAQEVIAARERAEARLEVRDGRARLVVDGRLTPPCFYTTGSIRRGTSDLTQIGDFRQAGVRIYVTTLSLGRRGDWNTGNGVWLGENQYDMAEVDERLWRILRADPEGYVMFYLMVDPYTAWTVEHPTEICCDQNGKKAVARLHAVDWGREPAENERYAPSYFSSVLREDTADALRALISHVKQSEAGKAVIGYHVVGGNDGQFFHWTRYRSSNINAGDYTDSHLADYSQAGLRAFREWLQRRYGNDLDAFRRAWDSPEVTFQDAEIPEADRRLAPGFFLDLPRYQDIADYNRFYSEGVAETLLHYGRVIKDETDGNALASVYYGNAVSNQDSHQALGRLLNSTAIDFFSFQMTYSRRLPGRHAHCPTTYSSIGLHGKLYVAEQDYRSWLVHPRGSVERDAAHGRVETAEEFAAMVHRDCGKMLAYGHGAWWYDMGGGWFNDEGIMQAIGQCRDAFASDLTLPDPPRAEVAVFANETSLYYMRWWMAAVYRYNGLLTQLWALNQAGVPYHVYLQSDIGREDLPEYKVYLFLNAQHVSPEEKTAIQALRRDNKVLAFVHAPGVVGAEDPAAAIEDLTGIAVKALAPADMALNVTPVTGEHPLLADLDGRLAGSSLSGPGFEVTDPDATPIGSYSTGEPAVAARDFGTWRSLFFGGVGMSVRFFHNLAKWGDAWCVASPGDAVYASEHALTIHALAPGTKTLTLLSPARVTDLTTGELIADSTQTLTLDMTLGETRWFALEP